MVFKEMKHTKPFTGMIADLKARIPLYIDDWKEGFHLRILSSALFMVIMSTAPAITFGSQIGTDTKNAMGTVEVLLSTTLCCGTYSLLAGQPLVVVGVTGPVAIFTETVYTLAESLGIDFMKWYAPVLSIGAGIGYTHLLLPLIGHISYMNQTLMCYNRRCLKCGRSADLCQYEISIVGARSILFLGGEEKVTWI
jgi:hypothetical protein